MPRRKQATAARIENIRKARKAKLFKNKESNDSHITDCAPSSGHDSELESGGKLEGHGGPSSNKESKLQDTCDGSEITDQSKLDHFAAVLREAQRVAVEAQREKDKQRTRPKIYTGKSQSTLRRYKKCQDDFIKQGYLPVFDYIAHVKEKNKHKELPRPPEATRPEEIVFKEGGGNDLKDNSTSNPMCNSVAQEVPWASHALPRCGGPREENYRFSNGV